LCGRLKTPAVCFTNMQPLEPIASSSAHKLDVKPHEFDTGVFGSSVLAFSDTPSVPKPRKWSRTLAPSLLEVCAMARFVARGGGVIVFALGGVSIPKARAA
jgi:hypothetical protein